MTRLRIALAALALCACTPPADKPAPQEAAQSCAPNVDPSFCEHGISYHPHTKALGGPLANGQWFASARAGAVSTCFGASPTQCDLTISCETASGTITITYARPLAPDQDVTLRVFDAKGTRDLFAHSYNDGAPRIIAEIPTTSADRPGAFDGFINPLPRIGIAVNRFQTGEISHEMVMPWDQSLAGAFAACKKE